MVQGCCEVCEDALHRNSPEELLRTQSQTVNRLHTCSLFVLVGVMGGLPQIKCGKSLISPINLICPPVHQEKYMLSYQCNSG